MWFWWKRIGPSRPFFAPKGWSGGGGCWGGGIFLNHVRLALPLLLVSYLACHLLGCWSLSLSFLARPCTSCGLPLPLCCCSGHLACKFPVVALVMDASRVLPELVGIDSVLDEATFPELEDDIGSGGIHAVAAAGAAASRPVRLQGASPKNQMDPRWSLLTHQTNLTRCWWPVQVPARAGKTCV